MAAGQVRTQLRAGIRALEGQVRTQLRAGIRGLGGPGEDAATGWHQGPCRPGEDAAEGRHQGLGGQVRTQLQAGRPGLGGPGADAAEGRHQGLGGQVQPRWMSVGVSVEGGLRCECCMKLCPGERAEACRGAGRLLGLDLGTQTGEVRQASPVLQIWSRGGLLMGRRGGVAYTEQEP